MKNVCIGLTLLLFGFSPIFLKSSNLGPSAESGESTSIQTKSVTSTSESTIPYSGLTSKQGAEAETKSGRNQKKAKKRKVRKIKKTKLKFRRINKRKAKTDKVQGEKRQKDVRANRFGFIALILLGVSLLFGILSFIPALIAISSLAWLASLILAIVGVVSDEDNRIAKIVLYIHLALAILAILFIGLFVVLLAATL